MLSSLQVLHRRESTTARVYSGLSTLSDEGLLVLHSGGKTIPLRLTTGHTQVLLLSPEHDIKGAFRSQEQGLDGEQSTNSIGGISLKRHGLIISDRMRRAVLEPAEVPPALPAHFR